MTHELYKVHRPKTFKQMVGSPEAVNCLKAMVKKGKIPHALVFTGPSGCGKTSAARIMAGKLECDPHELVEVNAAESKGIDTVRDIDRLTSTRPLLGKVKVFIMDECHKLTNDAQTAMLKMVEDPRDFIYYVFCTTDPQKIIPTLRNRCTEVRFSPLSSAEAKQLIESVAAKA
jgi:DNA polymerase-3 subunit gamma/tau